MSDQLNNDNFYMCQALELAARGAGFVAPNPMVGAVIVKEGQVIGSGYHHCYGGSHAEVDALNHCTESPSGATIYVSLEPCSHYGKTPPCADALLRNGLARVVVAMRDPNPLVAGQGIDRLRNGGVEVTVGVCEEEAQWLNRAYIKHITSGLPWVTIKAATTVDGKIATHTGSSRWVTGEAARRYVHEFRSHYGAVVTSIGTVLADDPLFNCRLEDTRTEPHQPIRVVVDSYVRLPLTSQLVSTDQFYTTLLFHLSTASQESVLRLKQEGIETIESPACDGKVDLSFVIRELGRRGINSVLVEAGGIFNASLVQTRLVDQLNLFLAPKLVGGAAAPTFLDGVGIEKMDDALPLTLREISHVGDDLLLDYLFVK